MGMPSGLDCFPLWQQQHALPTGQTDEQILLQGQEEQ